MVTKGSPTCPSMHLYACPCAPHHALIHPSMFLYILLCTSTYPFAWPFMHLYLPHICPLIPFMCHSTCPFESLHVLYIPICPLYMPLYVPSICPFMFLHDPLYSYPNKHPSYQPTPYISMCPSTCLKYPSMPVYTLLYTLTYPLHAPMCHCMCPNKPF